MFLKAMKFSRRIRLLEMKRCAIHWLWLFVLGAVLFGVGGCATNEPENASVRPWNTPQGWEGGMGGMMNQQQHE
jgi:hypothetical protein